LKKKELFTPQQNNFELTIETTDYEEIFA